MKVVSLYFGVSLLSLLAASVTATASSLCSIYQLQNPICPQAYKTVQWMNNQTAKQR